MFDNIKNKLRQNKINKEIIYINENIEYSKQFGDKTVIWGIDKDILEDIKKYYEALGYKCKIDNNDLEIVFR